MMKDILDKVRENDTQKRGNWNALEMWLNCVFIEILRS